MEKNNIKSNINQNKTEQPTLKDHLNGPSPLHEERTKEKSIHHSKEMSKPVVISPLEKSKYLEVKKDLIDIQNHEIRRFERQMEIFEEQQMVFEDVSDEYHKKILSAQASIELLGIPSAVPLVPINVVKDANEYAKRILVDHQESLKTQSFAYLMYCQYYKSHRDFYESQGKSLFASPLFSMA